MEAKRNDTVDLLKGVACIGVVFIHYQFVQPWGGYIKTLARIAVPFFFFVSGYFMVSKDLTIQRERIFRKIKHIISLIVMAAVFYTFFCIIWNHLMYSDWDILAFADEEISKVGVIKLLVTNDPLVYSHLWFLLALLYCYLTMLLFNNRKCSKWVAILVIAGMAGFSVLAEFGSLLGIVRSVPIIDGTSRIYFFNLYFFRALPFFLLGFFLRSRRDIIMQKKVPLSFLLVTVCVGEAIALIERFYLIQEEAQFYVGSYIALIALCILSVSYAVPCDKGCRYMLKYIGCNLSLYIYIFHIAVGKIWDLIAAKNHLYGETFYSWTRPIVVLICTILVCQLVFAGKQKILSIRRN